MARCSAAALRLVTGLLMSLAASAAPAPAPTPACDIKFGSFGTSATYLVTDTQGYFKQEGVNVCKGTVGGSVDQFQQLFNGTWDLISTTIDGTINRFVNGDLLYINGNTSNAVPAPVLQLLAGTYQTSDLSLWGYTKYVPTLANMSTNELGVDAPDSGFAFTARAFLTQNGLVYNSTANIKTHPALPGQYSAISVGGSRYNLVQAGTVNATIINAPATIVANMNGTNITRLDGGNLNGVPGTNQNSGYTIRQAWGKQAANAKALQAFFRALVRGSRFMRDPANRQVVIAKFVNASLAGQLSGVILNPVTAGLYLDNVNDPVEGENFDAGLNPLGVQKAIALRQIFCGFTAAGASAINAALGTAGNATGLAPQCGAVNATALAAPCPGCMINLDFLNAAVASLGGASSY